MTTSLLGAELRDCELFRPFSDDALALLETELERLDLPSGAVVFRQGDAPDGLYIVLRGRLRAIAENDGHSRIYGDAGRGGYVGELALLTGAPRSATVRAVRDSTLVRLSAAGFERIMASCPVASLSIARTVADRAQENARASLETEGFATLCVLVAEGDGGDGERFARSLVTALGEFARVAVAALDGLPSDVRAAFSAEDEGRASTSAAWLAGDWFDAMERDHRYVVYRSDCRSRAWTERCLRQADLVLLAAAVDRIPALLRELDRYELPGLAHVDLVVLHAGEGCRLAASVVAERSRFRRLFHVRGGAERDVARIARLLTGRGTALALSGGGRRGAAHVGTMRALEEAGVPIDLVAGTSAGAIVGGMVALEHGWRRALEQVRLLGSMRPWSDVGPPMVAMLSGRTIRRTLEACFGDARLEDVPMPFLPVCAAVDTGEVVIPDRGPLWLAVRASSSLPGIFPPVPWNGHLLMDGALLNNLPADLARSRCPQGKLIASNVGMPAVARSFPDDLHTTSGWQLLARSWANGGPRAPGRGVVELLVQAACAASTRHLKAVRGLVDCYIAPEVADHASLSRRANQDIDILVARAYDEARRALDLAFG